MLKSLDQVSDYWNKFSKLYSEELEPIYFQLALSLSRMLRVEKSQNTIEVGCGSGELSLFLLRRLPNGCKYTSFDIADDMLQLAREKKEALKGKLNDIEHSFKNGNAEDLKEIPDDSVDVYIASLVIHLTPNPNQLLKEALRVLKKGGRIGFTVLGKSHNSSMFDIAMSAIRKNGIDILDKSSGGLPLDNRESCIQIAKDNGFEVEFCWREMLTYDVFDEKGLIKVLGQPRIAKILSDAEPDLKQKILDDVYKTFYDLKSKFIPLQAEVFYLVAKKPE